VGATAPSEIAAIRTVAPDLAFLVPGIGAQGGDIEAVLADGPAKAGPAGERPGRGLVVNVSRGIAAAAVADGRGERSRDVGERLAEGAREWAAKLPVLPYPRRTAPGIRPLEGGRSPRTRHRQEHEMLPNIGAPELIIILVIALLILGPGKLPEVGASLGKSIREFRKASTDLQDSMKVDVDTSPLPATGPATPAAAPAAPVTPAAPPLAVAPMPPVVAPVDAAPGASAVPAAAATTSDSSTVAS
jgi:TatA/E family protein of Tat protein translocase